MSRSRIAPLVSCSSSGPRAGRGAFQQGYIQTGATSPKARRGSDTVPDTVADTHPSPCRASGTKGGVAPVTSPHRWRGSGRPVVGRNAEQRQRTNGRGGWDTPPGCSWDTPPCCPRPDFALPRSLATAASTTERGTADGAPSDGHLGGGQPDGGPDREAVNRPARGRLGGRALGELLQEDETIGRRVEPAGRAHEFTIAGGNCCPQAGRFPGGCPGRPWSARPGPPRPGRRRPGSSVSGRARRGPLPSTPVPTATMCTAKVRARSAAHNGAWATPHARSSLSVVWPGIDVHERRRFLIDRDRQLEARSTAAAGPCGPSPYFRYGNRCPGRCRGPRTAALCRPRWGAIRGSAAQ